MNRYVGIVFVLAGWLCSFSACGGQKLPPGMPKLSPVSLTFTVGGQPLDDAVVSLHSISGPPSLWTIGGTTDARGTLKLKTHGNYDGVPEGEFAVCVSKTRTVQGPTAQQPKPEGYGEYMAWTRQCAAESEQFLVVGREYDDAALTPLKITVKKGRNVIKIDDIPEDGTQIKFAQ